MRHKEILYFLILLLVPVIITNDVEEKNELEIQNKHIELNREKCEYKEDNIKIQNKSYCPQMFDGILCWNRTIAGTIAYASCPIFIIGFQNPKAYASRNCLDTGEWEPKRDDNGLLTNRTYTNYTECLQPNKDDLLLRKHIPLIKLVAKIGCSISLVSLIIALILMLFLKRLHCPRNILHVNLFASFLMFSIITLVKEIVMESVGYFDYNDYSDYNSYNAFKIDPNASFWQCKLLVSLHRYFESNNHVMIFCEALYLNTLVMYTTFNEVKYYKYYIIGGWLAPLLWVTPYIAVMAKFMRQNSCWSYETVYSYIYLVPLVIIILANFGLFINIMRILILKMRLNNNHSSRTSNSSLKGFFHSRYRRLTRSTLILIPLFNIYYTIFSVWQPFFNKRISIELELLRLYFEIGCASLQGFAISMIYCFTNSEVRAELIKIIERKLLQHNPNMRRFSSISHNTTTRKHSSYTSAKLKYNTSQTTMKVDLNDIDTDIELNSPKLQHLKIKSSIYKSNKFQRKIKSCCLNESRKNSSELTNTPNLTLPISTSKSDEVSLSADDSLIEIRPLKQVKYLSEYSFKFIDEDDNNDIDHDDKNNLQEAEL